MAAVFPWARTSRFRSMIVDTTQPPPAHRAPHAPLWRPNRSAAELSLVGVLTPLCVKTLVQARRANWFIGRALNRNPNAFSAGEEGFHELAAGLFMVGYDLRDA